MEVGKEFKIFYDYPERTLNITLLNPDYIPTLLNNIELDLSLSKEYNSRLYKVRGSIIDEISFFMPKAGKAYKTYVYYKFQNLDDYSFCKKNINIAPNKNGTLDVVCRFTQEASEWVLTKYTNKMLHLSNLIEEGRKAFKLPDGRILCLFERQKIVFIYNSLDALNSFNPFDSELHNFNY